ncbi:MAG: 3-hydroxyacyl-ACP dehydratase FabZ [Arenimonas sp.]|nr:3-hydroxyacyl-ACP dehydratase FabZ [Arenimonas sp.]
MAFDTALLPVEAIDIQKLLPHRYPFLLVDRVIELELHNRIRCIKNISINEPFFNGHFPGKPVMPGVLIIEALAQAGGCLTLLSSLEGNEIVEQNRLFYFVKIDNVRFKKMVIPGDQLILDVSRKRIIRNIGYYDGVATVNGKEVASAEIVCAEGQ